MTNQEIEMFLNIIDNRIKKYINENKLLKEYPALVDLQDGETGATNSKCTVRLAGYDNTKLTFINKSHETLATGNFVYIKTVGTDLNTGVISQKNS